jgi:hypothetical protein
MNESSNFGQGNARPTFLTVLCILTFIGSGLGVLFGLLGLVATSAISSLGLGMLTVQGSMIVQIAGLASAGLCLFGAIQMWGLKSQGFMLYLIGCVLGILGPIINIFTFASYASSLGLEGPAADAIKAAATTGVVVAIVFNGAFVLMYNANRKALVK